MKTTNQDTMNRTAGAAELEAEISPVLNFALCRRGLPLAKNITVAGGGPGDLTLEVRAGGGSGEVSARCAAAVAADGAAAVSGVPLPEDGFRIFPPEKAETAGVGLRVLAADGKEIAALAGKAEIQPFDFWPGYALSPEIIASFVVPGDPGAAEITARAEKILSGSAGGGFDGFGSGDPARAEKQAEALFEAVRELKIAGSPAPSGFVERGQRVRSPEAVLAARRADSLEAACLFASLLERAGLNPVVAFTDRRALAGFRTADRILPDALTDSRQSVTGDDIVLFDGLGAAAGGGDFAAARGEAARALAGESFVMAADVRRCRLAGIRPLPRLEGSGAAAKITEYEAPAAAAPAGDVLESGIAARNGQKITRLQSWENKLLDLSLRNRLLNVKYGRGCVPVIPASLSGFEDNLASGGTCVIEPLPEKLCDQCAANEYRADAETAEFLRGEAKPDAVLRSPVKNPEELGSLLQKFYREAQNSYSENGSNSFFLTAGMLKWYESEAARTPKYAPIILIPVELSRKNVRSPFTLSGKDEESIVNFSLLEMLRQFFRIEITGLDPLPHDEKGVDVNLILATVRNAVKDMPNWEVLETSVIGNFSFSKFVMWKDLTSNADILSRSPVFAALCRGEAGAAAASGSGDGADGERSVDGRFSYGRLCQPIMADTSQMDALLMSDAGESFVLQGPPGTGKSQTITNIIVNALAHKKKVLFVAEKMAALSVVQQRLAKIGLDPFCLELHSNKVKKTAVLERLDAAVAADSASPLEESAKICAELNAQREEIAGQIAAMHEKRLAGLSVYDAMCLCASADAELRDLAADAGAAEGMTEEKLKTAGLALREIAVLSENRRLLSEYPLRFAHPAGAGGAAPEDLKEYAGAAGACRDALAALGAKLGFDAGKVTAGPGLKALADLCRAAGAENLDAALIASGALSGETEVLGALRQKTARRAELAAELGENAADLKDLDVHALLKKWELDDRKFVLFRKLSHGGAVKTLQNALGAAVTVTPENFPDLARKAEEFKNLLAGIESDVARVEKLNPELGAELRASPDAASGRIGVTLKFLEAARAAEAAVPGAAVLAGAREALRDPAAGLAALRTLAADCLAKTEKFAALSAAAEEFFRTDPAELPESLDERAAAVGAMAAAAGDLPEWEAISSRLDALAACGFADLARKLRLGLVSAKIGEDAAARIFARSMCDYFIAREPALGSFRGILFEDRMLRFNENNEKFRELCKRSAAYLLASLRSIAQNRPDLAAEQTYLIKAVKSKGRKQSIRGIFDNISGLLREMCPCMLMSPLSAAQYLSPDKYVFDLVIFDEASQLPTSEAAGAIGRGKQVIVAGDSKQMPPTDFFSAKQNDEEDETADLESLLDDCIALRMPVKTLSWHYRSTHESLISFSNALYYGGGLYTFPSPDDRASRIEYRPVKGIYDRGGSGRNKEESAAVISCLADYLANPDNLSSSVGILTFNTKQQTLLEEDLEKLFRDRPELEDASRKLPEPLFVKNLENVQGDERDVMLFSIGFGPDKTGRVTLNFGPLNRAGGERRLNVAVTRSKKRMVIFSSLEPDAMHVSDVSPQGVKDLKAFLAYAKKGGGVLPAGKGAGPARADALTAEIAAALGKAGYECDANVGASRFKIDLAVRDPRRPDVYLACVLTDGRGFGSDCMIADKTGGQPAALRQLGWNIVRVWSCEWYKNRDKAAEQLAGRLRELGEGR